MNRITTAVFILAAIIAAVWVGRIVRSGPAEVTGHARVIDGDSLVVAGRELRLRGMDSPEGRQTCQRDGAEWPCGQAASDSLRRLVAQGSARCSVGRSDRFDRGLAHCEVAGRDLAAEMVEQGYAVAYGAYHDEEHRARVARRGLWSGTFERPREWRDRHDRRHR